MESLIDKYISKYRITLTVDYGDRNSVRRHNRAMDACRKIASTIQQQQPELKEDFFALLESDIPLLPILVAHHMIEVMEYEDVQKSKALNIIYTRSKEDSVEGLGNRMWLKNYLKENPNDEKLICH